MGTRNKKKARSIVAAVLFAFAGLCCVAIIIVSIVFSDDLKGGTTVDNQNATVSAQIQQEILYEKVNLQDMLDDLDTNALRAEKKYQGKHIEITGEIRVFDSDGKYIAIVPCGAPEWSIETVQCWLTDPAHKTFLLEKAVGDVITIRGDVFSIGEVLGYSVRIAEISD